MNYNPAWPDPFPRDTKAALIQKAQICAYSALQMGATTEEVRSIYR